jgi:hypothetical protein
VRSEDSSTPCCRVAILFPIAWSLVLLFLLPGIQVLFLGFRLAFCAVTILALIVLARSVSGWRHLLALPLWLLLAGLTYVTWAYPIWTQADYERARQEAQQKQLQR